MYPRREDRQGEATEGSGVKKHRLRHANPSAASKGCQVATLQRGDTQLFHSRIIDWLGCKNVTSVKYWQRSIAQGMGSR